MQPERSAQAHQRNAAASARNARPVVEAASQSASPMDRHWQAIARQLFEQGHEEKAVMEALRRQGCKTYMAADACKATRSHYRNVHHMAHRKEGLLAVVVGLGLWLLAGLFLLAAANGWLVGRLFLCAGGLAVGGIVPVVFGLYKVLTGSTVAIVLPEDLR